MWALRVLSGPQAGQMFPLKMGRNLIGRAPHCDLKIGSNGVSKEHAEIHVYKDKILIVDLRSSNGTYLNGVKVQNGMVRLGDKMGIHDVLMDIIPAPSHASESARTSASRSLTTQTLSTGSVPGPAMPPPMMPGSPNVTTFEEGAASAEAPFNSEGPLKDIYLRFEDYMNRVALPGVYRLAEILEFRMVLATFIILFIFGVTLLSMIPMIQITRASITQESMRRASSLARTLARANQQTLLQGALSSLSTHEVETEDGVKRALIVQQSDGVILAPASQAGNSPDLPFVVSARRESKMKVEQIDSDTIGASFPIGMYDPNTGEPMVKAHAIILYDVGSMAFDDGRALSLFFQTLVIAAILGMILFFFMYKLIEYPIVSLNNQLDSAMREKHDNLELQFQFPALQALMGNMNSLLTRYIHGDTEGGGVGGGPVNKDSEAMNLLHLIGYPAIAIRSDGSIIGCNQTFEQLARTSSLAMQNQTLAAVPDAALQQNIEHLVGRAREIPGLLHNDQLEFSGHLCALNCQAFTTSETPDYFVVSVSPLEGGG